MIPHPVQHLPRFTVRRVAGGRRGFVVEMEIGGRQHMGARSKLLLSEVDAYKLANAQAQAIFDFLQENASDIAGRTSRPQMFSPTFNVSPGAPRMYDVVSDGSQGLRVILSALRSASDADAAMNSIIRAVTAFRTYNDLYETEAHRFDRQFSRR